MSDSFTTSWTTACQTPLFMGFSRQEYWSGLPFPPPGDLPDPGIKPASLMLPALAGRFLSSSEKPIYNHRNEQSCEFALTITHYYMKTSIPSLVGKKRILTFVRWGFTSCMK